MGDGELGRPCLGELCPFVTAVIQRVQDTRGRPDGPSNFSRRRISFSVWLLKIRIALVLSSGLL